MTEPWTQRYDSISFACMHPCSFIWGQFIQTQDMIIIEKQPIYWVDRPSGYIRLSLSRTCMLSERFPKELRLISLFLFPRCFYTFFNRRSSLARAIHGLCLCNLRWLRLRVLFFIKIQIQKNSTSYEEEQLRVRFPDKFNRWNKNSKHQMMIFSLSNSSLLQL